MASTRTVMLVLSGVFAAVGLANASVLTVSVTSPQGALSGASIELRRSLGGEVFSTAQTGIDGTVWIDVENGPLHIRAVPPAPLDLVDDGTELTLRGDTEIRFVLRQRVRISGRVRSHEGAHQIVLTWG